MGVTLGSTIAHFRNLPLISSALESGVNCGVAAGVFFCETLYTAALHFSTTDIIVSPRCVWIALREQLLKSAARSRQQLQPTDTELRWILERRKTELLASMFSGLATGGIVAGFVSMWPQDAC